MIKLLAIDPSIRSLGYAACTVSSNTPICAGHVALSGDTDWHIRAAQMISTVHTICAEMAPEHIVIETPNNWFTEKGQSSKDNEAVQKLYYVVGGLCAALMAIPIKLWTVTPSVWKGQTPKSVSEKRARALLTPYGLGELSMLSDTWDAIHLAHTAVARSTTIMTNGKPDVSMPFNWSLIGGRGAPWNDGVTARVYYEV